tara:strand:- start:772 stop:1350 length:579 start_codon:yes stop_codon:yes gene_type:complete
MGSKAEVYNNRDDIMKQDNWTINTNKIRAWLPSVQDAEVVEAVNYTLGLGDKTSSDEMRTNYWSAIRNIAGKIEGFPSARVGQGSRYSTETQNVMNTVEATVRNAFAQIPTEHHELILAVIHPHGRTGGVFADFNAYCAHMGNEAVKTMKKALDEKEPRWIVDKKGNPQMTKDGVPMITPLPTKAEEAEEEE